MGQPKNDFPAEQEINNGTTLTIKTKEIKLGSEVNYFAPFKVEKSNEHSVNIYTGKDNDKHFIYTPQISFFNFDNYKEAQEMCDKLNRIADKYHQEDK